MFFYLWAGLALYESSTGFGYFSSSTQSVLAKYLKNLFSPNITSQIKSPHASSGRIRLIYLWAMEDSVTLVDIYLVLRTHKYLTPSTPTRRGPRSSRTQNCGLPRDSVRVRIFPTKSKTLKLSLQDLRFCGRWRTRTSDLSGVNRAL